MHDLMAKPADSSTFLPSSCEAELIDYSHRGGAACQQLWKLHHDGRDLLMKRYGLKRSLFRVFMRQFGSLALVGKSSISIAGRCRTEREVLALWRKEGFDAPEVFTYDELERRARPCLLMEWIEGELFTNVLYNREVPREHKAESIEKFAREWGRRHARVMEKSEPRLLMENPTFDHLFISNERLIHFDFEIVFTRKTDLERLIRREIAGILCSLEKSADDDFPYLLERMLSAYPEPARFARTADELLRFGSIPVIGAFSWMHNFIRNKKRYARRSLIAEKVLKCLEGKGT